MDNTTTSGDKRRILDSLQLIPQEDLLKYVMDGKISLQELKDTGNLRYDKREFLEAGLKKLEDDWSSAERAQTVQAYESFIDAWPQSAYMPTARERIAFFKDQTIRKDWDNARTSHDLDLIRRFIDKWPDSVYAQDARDLYRRLEEELDRKKREALDYVRANIGSMNMAELRGLYLDTHILTADDMIRAGIFSAETWQKLCGPPPLYYDVPTYNPTELAPLPEDKTDVYFFGLSGSGKTCVIGSILYQLTHSNIYKTQIDVVNPKGLEYYNRLMMLMDDRHVPKGTAAASDRINYVSLDVVYQNKNLGYNFIDFGGEYFNNYIKRKIEGYEVEDGYIDAPEEFLKSNNKKVIFIFVDYSSTNKDRISQNSILSNILTFLSQNGLLIDVTSIQLVITKSDLYPVGEDRAQHSRDYIENHYNLLKNTIQNLQESHGINNGRRDLLVTPLSLGHFMMGKVFEYDPTDTQALLATLMGYTEPKRQAWFKKFLN
jgi:GTPase SAR1 family protein